MLLLFSAAAAADPNLVGLWPFDEGWGSVTADLSGNGNHGTLYGAIWTTGAVGGHALSFHGNLDVVDFGEATAVESPRLTAAICARAPVSPGGTRYLISKGSDGCASCSFGLYTASTSGLAFYVSAGGGAFVLSPDAGVGVWDGAWHHIAGTYDGNAVRLYVDGAEVGSGTPTTLSINYLLADRRFRVGNNAACPGGAWGFVGDLDEVEIWNRALAPSEIADIAHCPACSDAGPGTPYGSLVFEPQCTSDATHLPGGIGDPFAFARRSVPFYRTAKDRLYLSRQGASFTSLVVDDEVHVNGQDSGLGPYAAQPGVPPFTLGVPIEQNLVPEPPVEVTNLVPLGTSNVVFEAVDTERGVYGHTAVHLLVDCGIWFDESHSVHFLSHADWELGAPVEFAVRCGDLSELRADGHFARSSCLAGTFLDIASDPNPDPAPSTGRYYLASGITSCTVQGWGESKGLVPDPRLGVPDCP